MPVVEIYISKLAKHTNIDNSLIINEQSITEEVEGVVIPALNYAILHLAEEKNISKIDKYKIYKVVGAISLILIPIFFIIITAGVIILFFISTFIQIILIIFGVEQNDGDQEP